MSVVSVVTDLAKPVIEELGLKLWDVEFKKEGSEYFLRIYIDRDEGVWINDCEEVSRRLDPLLDELDPIEQSYNFEVSSAGLVRELKKDEHILKFVGHEVSVSLFKPDENIGKMKKFNADIKGVNGGYVEFIINGKEFSVDRKNISKIVVDLV